MDNGIGDLLGSIVVVELIAHQTDCRCLYPIIFAMVRSSGQSYNEEVLVVSVLEESW